jgi:uncharacterized membrane protein YjjB (DUF3815 family)
MLIASVTVSSLAACFVACMHACHMANQSLQPEETSAAAASNVGLAGSLLGRWSVT